MTTRPSLIRSIPFWALVGASLATALAGAFVLFDRLGVMTTTLTDGTATGVEVYVGQSLAGLGATLLGVGIVGILIALATATAATLRAHAPAVVSEPIDWTAESDDDVLDGASDGDELSHDAPAAERPTELSSSR